MKLVGEDGESVVEFEEEFSESQQKNLLLIPDIMPSIICFYKKNQKN